MRAAVAALAALAVAHAVPAVAAPPTPPATLAAIAPDDADVRRSVVLGPSGQIYEPAPDGWQRRAEGGVAATVTSAARTAHGLVTGGEGAVFRYEPSAGWTALHLGRGAAIIARGPRAVVAVARELFDVTATPVKLAAAPEAVTAIGSSRAGVIVVTGKGLYRLTGSTLRRLGAPPPGATPVGDRWAVTAHDATSLATGARASSDLTIAAAAQAPDGTLVAIATTGADLMTIRGDGFSTEHLALSSPGTPVAIAVDGAGRILIAYADGHLALGSRTEPSWTLSTVHDQLPPARPGPPPALAR